MKEQLDRIVREWIFAPAEWWQFWLPQSGARGGLISATVIWIASRLL